jgi:hypothetical protein
LGRKRRRFRRASSTRRIALATTVAVKTWATAQVESFPARSHRVLAWATSNRRVTKRYVLKMEEGRMVRSCSTYERRPRARVERREMTIAAMEVRVRAADGLAQRISAASCSAPRPNQADCRSDRSS